MFLQSAIEIMKVAIISTNRVPASIANIEGIIGITRDIIIMVDAMYLMIDLIDIAIIHGTIVIMMWGLLDLVCLLGSRIDNINLRLVVISKVIKPHHIA